MPKYLPKAGKSQQRSNFSAYLLYTKSACGGLDSPLYVLLIVCDRDKAGFELRRRQVNALFEHRIEVSCEFGRVRGLCRIEIRDCQVREKQRKHRAAAVDRVI